MYNYNYCKNLIHLVCFTLRVTVTVNIIVIVFVIIGSSNSNNGNSSIVFCFLLIAVVYVGLIIDLFVCYYYFVMNKTYRETKKIK